MPSLHDLMKFTLVWWVIGLAVVSWFILSIRPSDAGSLYAKMRIYRSITLGVVMREAWIWPVFALGLLAMMLNRRLGR